MAVAVDRTEGDIIIEGVGEDSRESEWWVAGVGTPPFLGRREGAGFCIFVGSRRLKELKNLDEIVEELNTKPCRPYIDSRVIWKWTHIIYAIHWVG